MRTGGWLLALVLAVPCIAEDEPQAVEVVQEEVESLESVIADAEAKAAAGDLEGAGKVLQKAAGGEPAALLHLGRIQQTYHDLDNAMAALETAGKTLTGAAQGEALGRLALVQEIRGMPGTPDTAAAAVAADPEGAWPNLALARTRAREGQADEAKTLAEKAVAAGGGASAAAALGLAHEAGGDLAAAETAYREAVATAADDEAANIGLARVLRKTGRVADAQPIADRILELSFGAIEAYKERARIRIALGQADQAMGDAQIAAAMADQDEEAKRLVQEVTVAQALSFVEKNQASEAVRQLTQLKADNPDMAVAYYGMGVAYVAQKKIDEALVELRKAVELDPKLADAQYKLGNVLHTMKRDARGALAPYEQAVALAPANTEFRTNLGAVLSDLGESRRAIEELTRVVETPGYGQANAWIYLGGAYVGAKKYREAIEPLKKSLEIAPDVAQTHAYLAWSYFGMKDADNFVKHARKAKSLGYTEETLMKYLKMVGDEGQPIT